MFAPLILAVLAIYLFLGWLVIAALDRRMAQRRSGSAVWVGVIFWPITVMYDLLHRHGANRG